jgi:hypothetical protein
MLRLADCGIETIIGTQCLAGRRGDKMAQVIEQRLATALLEIRS